MNKYRVTTLERNRYEYFIEAESEESAHDEVYYGDHEGEGDILDSDVEECNVEPMVKHGIVRGFSFEYSPDTRFCVQVGKNTKDVYVTTGLVIGDLDAAMDAYARTVTLFTSKKRLIMYGPNNKIIVLDKRKQQWG